MTRTAKLITLVMMVFAAILPVQAAKADFINGDNLRLYCASQNPSDEAICIVYITGAVDAFTTAELIAEKTSGVAPTICLPEDTGPDALKIVVQRWMERPEANLDFAATLVILGAVQDAYSCS
ncbi:MAG: hypothetical protein J4F41_04485 [Alphaproteobacteria bacterium]|nr:hypothetical protein [Alphaproteobacteria bacterium]